MTDHYDAYQSGYKDGYAEGYRQYWHNVESDPTDLPELGRPIEVVVMLPSGHDQFRWRGNKLPQHTIRWMYVPEWMPETED